MDVCNNFMGRAVEDTGITLIRPLWQLPRLDLINDLDNFEVIVTCCNVQQMGAEAQALLGKRGDAVWKKLRKYAEEEDAEQQVDGCGERGEFHTMVLNAPLFKQRVELGELEVMNEDHLTFLKIKDITLI